MLAILGVQFQANWLLNGGLISSAVCIIIFSVLDILDRRRQQLDKSAPSD
jgi:hypothetical membrane protein